MRKLFFLTSLLSFTLAGSDCAFGQQAGEKDAETARALAGHVELKW